MPLRAEQVWSTIMPMYLGGAAVEAHLAQIGNHQDDKARETLRPSSKSARDSPPPWFEPGTVLDTDRRDPKRRVTLRKRPRDAQACARAFAPGSRRADRLVASQARRLRNHQLSQGIASGSVSQLEARRAHQASPSGGRSWRDERRRACKFARTRGRRGHRPKLAVTQRSNSRLEFEEVLANGVRW